MRTLVCFLAALVILAAGIGPVFAQDIPIPSFVERGLDTFLGGGQDAEPGAAPSPAALPGELLPSPAEAGITRRRPLERLEPIPLPEGFDDFPAPEIEIPGLPAYAPQDLPSLDGISPPAQLVLEPRLTEDGQAIPDGVTWSLFSPVPGSDGKLPLVASATGGTVHFTVAPGTYLLHAGFGRAGITRRIDFNGVETWETVVLNAGGLSLDATTGEDASVPPEKLTFDIYTDAAEERDRRLIAKDIPPDTVVRLNAGTYHVVSSYGTANATMRADIRVQPGKVTEATIQHHAAEITMKLVREKGGEAIADTAWSITTLSGDVIHESVSAYSTVVLSEGDYLIVAKNRDRLYQRQFTVVAGKHGEVEVLTTTDLVVPEDPHNGSGDEAPMAAADSKE